MLRKLSQEEQAKERKVAEGQRRVRILKGEREGRIAWRGESDAWQSLQFCDNCFCMRDSEGGAEG